MAQTVIGIFRSESEAQNAVNQLLANGFSDDNVDMSRGSSSGSSSSSSTSLDSGHENESGISKFFQNLFGSDNDDSDRYTRVAERGYVVTVHASSTSEAESVATLLDQYGAIDVDDQDNQYNSGGPNYSGTTGSDLSGTSGILGASGLTGTSGVSGGSGFSADSGVMGGSGFSGGQGFSADSGVSGVSGTTGVSGDSDYSSSSKNMSDNTGKVIPIIEESLQVGKKEVETGGVRLRSRIIEKPVEESLRLREERVRVERKAVDRPASPSDLTNFQEGTIEMTETSEIPVVSKEARIVEEISLGKEVEHREETIRDTVRKTEVDIENIESDINKKNKL
jgi:uncharacterized protein (TIGR02271 family)